MQSKEELRKLYSTFSDRKLLDIINYKDQYTETALDAAYEEVKRRNIQIEQVQDYVENKVLEARISEQAALIELTFFEKMKFFFIWILPFFGTAFKMNFIEDGLDTKLKQSRIFSTVGFLTFMLTGFLAVLFEHSNFESVLILILFFILTFFIENRLGGYSEQTLPPYRRKVYHLFRVKVYHLLATCFTHSALHRFNITDLFFSSQGLSQKFYSMS